MNIGTIFLLSLWIGSHLLIVLTVPETKVRMPVFFVIGGLLLVSYAMKPYTYDLNKYSIYFNTGYIEGSGWNTTKEVLDPRDITGDRFAGGYSGLPVNMLILVLAVVD